MKFFQLSPAVAGGLGKNTVMDSKSHPPTVSRLHYEFDDWMGDDLIESFPCFIITERLATELDKKFTGCAMGQVEISESEQFKDLNPNSKLPVFKWLQVTGRAGADDFGLSTDGRLIVSDKALACIKKFNIENCETDQF